LEDIKPSNSSLKLGHRGNPTDTPGSVDNSGYYLNGLIDEIKIYNRSLTRKEIETEFKEILKPHAAITISSDAELAATADSGTGSVEDPFVLEKWIINTTYEQPIYIYNTNAHFVIKNCWFETGNTQAAIVIQNAGKGTITLDSNYCTKSSGIVVDNVNAVLITDNVCLENDEGEGFPCGVHLINSESSNITNNYFSLNGDCGIWLTNSPNCKIQGNICNQNHRGIEVQSSINLTIINNTFNHNEIGGIWMYGQSSNSLIESNMCRNNSYGIQFENSHQCVIQWNTLIGNDQYGVWLIGSDYNIICYNSFTDNNNGSFQTQDLGTNNQWFKNIYSPSVESSNYPIASTTTKGSSDEGRTVLSDREDDQIMNIISSLNLPGILILLAIFTGILFSYRQHQR
jgi:parallel beta-helix repeat protein